MEFGFTSEQEMLRKSFSEFLTKECPIETVKERLESDAGFSTGVWRKIADLGWLGLLGPASQIRRRVPFVPWMWIWRVATFGARATHCRGDPSKY